MKISTFFKPLSFIPAILIMYMIYSFSAQPGEVSSSTSYKVSESIVSTYNKVTQQNWESWQIQEKANQINKYVRKGAHVTEYFLLAVAVSFPLYVYGVRGILLMLLAGAICVGYAFGDERHQAMVAGRVSTPRDVGIDSIGIFIGIILVRILGWSARVSVTGPRMERQQRKIQQELDRREEELAYREEMLRRRERKDDMRQTADQTFERERSQGQTRAYRPDEMTRRDRYTSNPYMESRYNQDSWNRSVYPYHEDERAGYEREEDERAGYEHQDDERAEDDYDAPDELSDDIPLFHRKKR